jgi:hypothetical protein
VADQITVTYKVNEDGSLTKITKKANEAADATDRAGAAAGNYQKKQKGVGQAGLSSAKAFSKMTTGITGGLVPAYATLAANVFAITAAFNFFKRAADVKILEEGQKSYAASTGLALKSITANLREASGGMLGFREAAEAAAIGVAKGFSPEQLNSLAEGARKASTALGRNFEDAFDRLIRGASKAEPELLDELGITLRLETATRRYADSINKTAKDLNTFEKSQAVLIETQRQLDAQFGQMEGKVNPFVQLAKTFEDLVKTGTNFVMPLFEGLAAIINRSAVAAIAVFGALGVSILKSMLPMEGIKEMFKDFELGSQTSIDNAKADIDGYKAKLEELEIAQKEANAQTVGKSAGAIGPTKSKLITKAQQGKLVDPKEIGQLKAHLRKAEAEFRRTGEVKKGIFKGADLQVMQSLSLSLKVMGVKHSTFIQRKKMGLKSYVLYAKFAYAQVKAFGLATFAALGRGAMRMGGIMNKALSFAGFIGMAMLAWEMIKTLAMNIGTIMRKVMKVIENLVNGIITGINFMVQGIGKGIDFVFNGLKAMANQYIKIYNLIPGLDDIELLNTKTTSVADAFSNVIEKQNFMDDNSVLDWADGVQSWTTNLVKAGEAYDALSKKIKTLGEDLKAATEGNTEFLEGTNRSIARALARGKIDAAEAAKMRQAMNSKVEQNRATTVGSSGVSNLMRQIEETTDPKYKKKLQDQLNELMPGLLATHKGMAAAIAANQIEVVESLEETARKANAGIASLNNSILDLGSAMGSGDLLKAEIVLGQLKDTSELTSANFKELFGEDSEAAQTAMNKYQEAFTKAGTTTEEFRQRLIDLRTDMQNFAKSKLAEAMLGGPLAQVMKARNAILEISLSIRALTAEKVTASEKRKLEIDAEIELLKLKMKIAKIDKDALGAGNVGQGVAGSVGVFETMQALPKDAGILEIADQASQVVNPLIESMKKMGPEGEAVAAMLEGFQMMITQSMNLRDVLNEIAEKMEINMPASFKEFKAMWKSMDMQQKTKVLGAAFGALGSQIGALNGAIQAKAKQAVAAIDKEIAAEKKRDGKSAASQAKIAAMEKKKEIAKRKAFETDKKMKIAQTIMSTAQGIMAAFSMGPILGPIFGAMVAATGAMQLSVIQGMQFDGGGSAPSAPSKVGVGNRKSSVDMAKSQGAGGELAYMRGGRGTGGPENFRPAFSGYKHRASGGYVVGEQGPELFMPDTPGQIVPSGQGDSTPINATINISAVDSAGVQDVLINQRGHIISMIREAANAQGDGFLENINVAEL